MKCGVSVAPQCLARETRCGECFRAEAQDTALLESNRSGASARRLILAKRLRAARLCGAGLCFGKPLNPGPKR
jgi:hypothetical protein